MMKTFNINFEVNVEHPQKNDYMIIAPCVGYAKQQNKHTIMFGILF